MGCSVLARKAEKAENPFHSVLLVSSWCRRCTLRLRLFLARLLSLFLSPVLRLTGAFKSLVRLQQRIKANLGS